MIPPSHHNNLSPRNTKDPSVRRRIELPALARKFSNAEPPSKEYYDTIEDLRVLCVFRVLGALRDINTGRIEDLKATEAQYRTLLAEALEINLDEIDLYLGEDLVN